MDLTDFRVFVTVAEELHFGRAAARLHMAQPHVSRRVKSLEQELGTKLFTRTTRFVQLTPAGEAFITPARRILDESAKAVESLAAIESGRAGRVSIAFAGASTHDIVGRLARSLRIETPGITLELSSQNFAEPAMTRLLNGEVDIALGRWDVIPAGVRSRLLVEEQLVVAVPADHPLADSEGVHMQQLSDENFVMLPPHPGSVLTDRFRRLCYGAGFEPEVVQIAPDTWTAMSLVSAAVGCSLTISTVAHNVPHDHLRFLQVHDKAAPVELRMAWRYPSRNTALHAVLEVSERILPTPNTATPPVTSPY